MITIILVGVLALAVGAAVGWFFKKTSIGRSSETALREASKIRERAEEETRRLLQQAKGEGAKLLDEAKAEARELRLDIRKREDVLVERERDLTRARTDVDQKLTQAELRFQETEVLKAELSALKDQEVAHLSEIAKLSEEDAKSQLFLTVERRHADMLQKRLQALAEEGEAVFARRAQEVLLTALQRYGGSHATDATTSVVAIPSDELKGRIIGKEGRNIKAFERATGCEVLVDETPGAIVVSSFDPIRREVAKRALNRLLEDGRIQPARIEELVEVARSEVEEIVRQAGIDAVDELSIGPVDPRLVYLIGRLRFRTSFGQNVLQHSVEAAHIAGMIASELKADVRVAKFGALVHDLGKAVDHEVEGTHVDIGMKLLKRFGVDDAVIKAMQSHHGEYPVEVPEAVIVQVAESISAARPGARRDSVENYLKRLSELERIASSFDGIERSYAIQAGREVRVFVVPEKIDDTGAQALARQIADRIEQELQYPGEIKITVIRERRVVEFAK